jgi:hypothetical protein
MKLQGLVKVCAAMLFCLSNQQLFAQQLKLGTNPSLIKPSALLELESKKQALLITRIADTALITSPVNGMIIYLEPDNSFRVRANNYWTKLISEGSAVKSINSDLSAAQIIKATYTPAGTFGFSTAAGTHNLTIPDAGLTASGFVNIGSQSFKGQKIFADGLQTLNLRVSNDLGTPTKILGKDASGDVSALTLGSTMSLTAGALSANNTTKLWNANKIADYDVLFSSAPLNDQVLTFNGTQWIAKAPVAGGITSIGFSMPTQPLFTITGSPLTANGTITANLNTQTANLVFAGPATGVAAPSFRALTAADLPTLSNYIQNTTTTQATSNFNISGAGVIGTTLTVKGLTPGSVPFIGTGGLLSENNAGLSWNNATPKLTITGTMRLTGNLSTPTNILGRDNNGDINNVILDNTTLAITTGTLAAKKGDPVWNASQLQSKAVSVTGLADGQVLKWNNTSSTFLPADDITGGASYGDLTDGDIMKATAPDPVYRMKIWKSPFVKVVNGPDTGPTGAFAWSTLSFQNINGAEQFTTQLYFDKNTLALKEWKGINTLTENGNPWYKVVTTLGSNIFTVGGIMFANQSVDATSEVTQDAGNFFWDNTAKELGLKTNAPNSTLHVNGSVATNIRTVTTTTYTVLSDDYTVVLTSAGTITVTIPAADANNKGRIYIIKKGINNTSAFRIVSSSMIEFTAANTNTSSTTAGVKWVLQSDGNRWWIIN